MERDRPDRRNRANERLHGAALSHCDGWFWTCVLNLCLGALLQAKAHCLSCDDGVAPAMRPQGHRMGCALAKRIVLHHWRTDRWVSPALCPSYELLASLRANHPKPAGCP